MFYEKYLRLLSPFLSIQATLLLISLGCRSCHSIARKPGKSYENLREVIQACLACLGSFYGKYKGKNSPKAPYNDFAFFWFSKCTISFWENPENPHFGDTE